MDKINDQRYLRTDQYRDASNLQARINLHERFSVNPQGFFAWEFGHLSLHEGSSVLEIGCGPGLFWSQNLNLIPSNCDFTLTDYSEGMAEQARKNLDGAGHNFHFAVADAQALPFPDERFSMVIANYMLYHVPDRAHAYREIRRVLRPGGHFYAATLGKNHLAELFGMVDRFQPGAGVWELPFTLENGGDEISPHFSDLTLRHYEDALIVTEVEPLVAYILSGWSGISRDKEAELGRFIGEEMAQGGAIHISKESGLFSAHKR